MAKAVLMSIQPKWCALIESGEKTVEVRKTMPNDVQVPFKVYIYCTLCGSNQFYHKSLHDDVALWNRGNWGEKKGKVIGEFTCRSICEDTLSSLIVKEDAEHALQGTCLTKKELMQYLGYEPSQSIFFQKHYNFFDWYISDLMIYEQPKELSEFIGLRKTKFGYAPMPIIRAPQSWQYVEEATEND